MQVFDKNLIFFLSLYSISNNIFSFKFLIQVVGPFVPLLEAAARF